MPKAQPDKQLVTIWVPKDLLAQFDTLAESQGRSRSNALRRLMERAVASPRESR